MQAIGIAKTWKMRFFKLCKLCNENSYILCNIFVDKYVFMVYIGIIKKRKEVTNMRVQYTINNYQLGAKLKTCPIHKIISQTRIDSKHVVIIFEINQKEMELVNKVFAKIGKIL